MAVDIFLKVDGIKGESTDKTHEKEIDILSWTWGATNSGSFHMGPGGGAGKANVSDLTVQKYVDASSTEFMNHCLTGKHIAEAKLTVRKAGGSPLEYLVITIKDILVTGVQPSGAKDNDRLMETVSLNFAEVKMEYETQDKKGGKGEHYAVGYSIQQNTTV